MCFLVWHTKGFYMKILNQLIAFGFVIVASMAQAVELPDFVTLVKENQSSVVKITTVYEYKKKDDDSTIHAYGSGFIISQDGYILTNHHVIEDSIDTKVKLSNGKLYNTLLIGSDKDSDVALLKIEGKNLNPVKIGDSDKVDAGEWVLAIGSPLGLDHSVTAGIISAKGRALGNERYVPFIQSDVSINPGNSGGPLFNLKGEVIGINSQILSKSGGSIGLSFSIPMNTAMNIVEQLKEDGNVQRGWLGISMDKKFNDSIKMAKKLGALNNYGVLVNRVTKNSPADDAGLKKDDIITHFNGEQIKYTSSLLPMVLSFKPGDEVVLTVFRDEEEIKITVTLGKSKK